MTPTSPVANHEVIDYAEYNSHRCVRCGLGSATIHAAEREGVTIPCDRNFVHLDDGWAHAAIGSYLLGLDMSPIIREKLFEHFGITV